MSLSCIINIVKKAAELYHSLQGPNYWFGTNYIILGHRDSLQADFLNSQRLRTTGGMLTAIGCRFRKQYKSGIPS